MIIEEIEKILEQNPNANIAVFLRHGEREHNPDPSDIGETLLLTDGGKEMAFKVGKSLSKFNVRKIYSSPVLRCVQTVNHINIGLENPLSTFECEDWLKNIHINLDAPKSANKKGNHETYYDFVKGEQEPRVKSVGRLKIDIAGILANKIKEQGIHIFVSHDNVIAHLRTALGCGVYSTNGFNTPPLGAKIIIKIITLNTIGPQLEIKIN